MYGVNLDLLAGRFVVELVFCSNVRAVTNSDVTGGDDTVGGVVKGDGTGAFVP